jgi:long-chain fatty acid transport protein
MKKISKLALGVLVIFSTITMYATEAYSPIAYGVKSRGMGGVGIATVHGAESGFNNPALLSFLEKNEVSIGFTYMKSDIKAEWNSGSADFDAGNTFTPYAVFNYKVSDNLNLGAGISTFSLKINNPILSKIKETRLSIPVSYSIKDLSFGISLISEQKSLKVSESNAANNNIGYDIGIAYSFPKYGIIVASDYKSKIKHKLPKTADFNSIELNSPSEIGIGLSWQILDSSMIGIDYKKIQSSEIFGRDNMTINQNIFAFGYMYRIKKWKATAGYRYVSDLYSGISKDSESILPYISTSHFTLGGGYVFTKNISTDFAIVYATGKDTNKDVEFTNNQASVSFGVNYIF